MRGACIDIGSNTTRLLVAERTAAGLDVVLEDRVFTHLGAELVAGTTISAQKTAEVAAVIVRQRDLAAAQGAATLRAVATAAVRRASNRDVFIDRLQALTQVRIEVLADREEARLAFVGAAGTLAEPVEGPLGVLDVGGGSSEIVIGEPPGTVLWWASLPVGSGGLARQLPSDPPNPAELERARAHVDEALADRLIDAPRPVRTLAVGGSATSLCRVCGPLLDGPALVTAVQVLAKLPSRAVAAHFAIDPQRARLLPAGLAILQALAAAIGGPVTCGHGGLREGVILEL